MISRKSHIAIEYCYRFREQNPGGVVVWIAAGSPARMEQSLTEIARKLSIPSYTDSPLQDFLKWFDVGSHPNRLLVFDDLVPESLNKIALDSLIENQPLGLQGSIILTTECLDRSYLAKINVTFIIVPSWTKEEAYDLLKMKVAQEDWNESSAALVVELLDFHPLAITLAASYIKRGEFKIEKHLENLRAASTAVVTEKDGDSPEMCLKIPRGLELSMTLCFEQLKMEKPRAVDLLFRISTLDPQGIPKTLLFHEGEKVRGFNAAIRLLNTLALVTHDTVHENLWAHRLVHSWTRNKLRREQTMAFWNLEVIKLLAERFPHGECSYWRNCNFLLPHAEGVFASDMAKALCLHCRNTYFFHRAALLQSMASYDEHRGFYAAAYAKYDEALSICHGHKWIGEKNKITQEILKKVPQMLGYLGRYQEARTKLEDALGGKLDKFLQEIEDDSEGLEDDTGIGRLVEEGEICDRDIYSSLARIVHEQGDYKFAGKCYKRALKMAVKAKGMENVTTLTIKSNLAGLKRDQGNYTKAEKMTREVLDCRRAIRGAEHPDTIQSMSNLVVILISQGKYMEAEEICEEALKVANKVQGVEHPDTLIIYGNLAGVLSRQGKYQDAADMQRHLLASKRKAFGPAHPSLISTRINLAVDLEKLGQYAEAEEEFTPAVAAANEAFGPDHPTTLNATNGLALVMLRLGKHEQAEPILRRVMQMRLKLFGEENQQTLISMNNLAGSLQKQGKFAAAEELHRQTFAGAKKVLGEKHPFALRSGNNLAEVLREWAKVLGDKRKLVEAEELQRMAWKRREEVLGEDHPDTVTSMQNLARILNQKGEVAGTIPLYQRAVEGLEKSLGGEHVATKTCKEELELLLSRKESGKGDLTGL